MLSHTALFHPDDASRPESSAECSCDVFLSFRCPVYLLHGKLSLPFKHVYMSVD